jgi:hypothetical protein
MTHKDYLEIILSGYIDNDPDFLLDHFKRECKKAEGNGISFAEFLTRLKAAYAALVEHFDKPYSADFYNWTMYKNQEENKISNQSKAKQKVLNKHFEETKPQKENYTLNVLHLTRDSRHIGLFLGSGDIEYIANAINLMGIDHITTTIDSLNEKFDNILKTNPPNLLPTTFKEIFIESDYEKHLEPLCTIEKPLLKKNDDKSYTLLRGKGAICRYFYQDLKGTVLKNKVKQEDISNVLFTCIKDFGTKPNRNSYAVSFIYNDLIKYISHKK